MSKDTKNQVGADLENNAPLTLSKNANKETVNFADRKFLETANPNDFHTKENVSSKFEKEREAKIQLALPMLSKLKLNDKSINPLVILLGKWWEVKPARAAIRQMITEEAESKGIDKNVYLQVNIANEIEAYEQILSGIQRICYAKTYFKPRAGLNTKVITQQLRIDGIVYIVPVAQYQELKTQFGKDIDGLKKALVAISEPLTIDEL